MTKADIFKMLLNLETENVKYVSKSIEAAISIQYKSIRIGHLNGLLTKQDTILWLSLSWIVHLKRMICHF